MKRALRVNLVLLAFAPMWLWAWDPEPFRRDEIEGRDFEYGDFTFLHHFTYRYRPFLDRSWRLERQGFRTTVGSIRSTEFYVLEELRKRFELSERLQFEFRQKIDEDFDGRYDRALTGFGWRFSRVWTATAMGDFVGEKENIDAHLELAWRDERDRFARVAVVLPDAAFDRKSDEGEYKQKPLTLFGEGRWLSDGGLRIGAWVNVNPELELVLPQEDLLFGYDQFSAGAEAVVPLGDVWLLVLEGGVEEGSREWLSHSAAGTDGRRFRREHGRFGLTLERPPANRFGGWVGARYFDLTEDDQRPQEAALTGRRTRDEKLLHAGLVWRLRDNLLLWPGVYLNDVDNRDAFPLNPDLDDEEDGLFVKVALPVEFSFRNGAFVTLNQTLRFEGLRSGGTDVQVIIPF